MPATSMVESLRAQVAAGFRRIVSGDPNGTPEWAQALAHGADAGYFGPGSAAWAVHASLPTLVGGVRALLMQTLHPAALAGVVQH
ncbi:MAG: oxygenase MpaB family protein, partial [Actinomycetales bacterium]